MKKGTDEPVPFEVEKLFLVAKSCRCSQGSKVRIAIRSVKCIGRYSFCKPLQQGLRLRMVGCCYAFILQSYRETRIRQDLNRISGFQVTLANTRLARELPARCSVVDERIVE